MNPSDNEATKILIATLKEAQAQLRVIADRNPEHKREMADNKLLMAIMWLEEADTSGGK